MGQLDWKKLLTGVDPSGGGLDEWEQPIPGMIPGGGALTGLAGVAGGIGDLMGSKDAINKARKGIKGAKGRRDVSRGGLDDFEFDVSQAQRDLATAGIRPTDTSYIDANTATILGQNQDPRANNPTALLNSANAAKLAASQGDLQRELTAMGGLADLEQGALEKKQDLELNLLSGDYAESIADIRQGKTNLAQAKQQKKDAWGNIIGGVANVGLSLVSGGIAKEGGRVKYNEGGQIPEELMQQIMAENQGQPPVQKTEGEFDHDTNKKAIVDEETGEKEGEATGGEYILNPDQGDAIKGEYESIVQKIDNGEEPTLEELQSLFEAVHEVFGQPQFNEA